MNKLAVVAVVGVQLLFVAVSLAQPPVRPPELVEPVKPADGQSSPEYTLRQFAYSLNIFDAERAARYVTGAYRKVTPHAQIDMMQQVNARASIQKIEVQRTRQRAAAQITLAYTSDLQEAGEAAGIDTEYLLLENDGREWRILGGDPATWHRSDSGTIQRIATSLAHPEVWSDEAFCTAHMQALSQGLKFFIADWEGKLDFKRYVALHKQLPADDPEAQHSLFHRALRRYVGFDGFVCPTLHHRISFNIADSYVFNDNLHGAIFSADGLAPGPKGKGIIQPERTVMIYEGKDGKLDFRHNGRAAVAFADGHVELINEEQAKTLRWTP